MDAKKRIELTDLHAPNSDRDQGARWASFLVTIMQAKGETRATAGSPPVSPSSRPWRVQMGQFSAIADAKDRPRQGVGVGCVMPRAFRQHGRKRQRMPPAAAAMLSAQLRVPPGRFGALLAAIRGGRRGWLSASSMISFQVRALGQ